MFTKIKNFISSSLKTNLPEIRPGDTVKVHQRIKEKDKERIQIFEGLVIARSKSKEIGATITVRKVMSGVGTEKIIPLHSPVIEKIEIVKRGKVRRAKLYYIREAKGRKSRLKKQDFSDALPVEETPEVSEEPITEEVPEKETVSTTEDIKIEEEVKIEEKKD